MKELINRGISPTQEILLLYKLVVEKALSFEEALDEVMEVFGKERASALNNLKEVLEEVLEALRP